MLKPIVLITAFLMALPSNASADSDLQPIIDALREIALSSVGADRIGSGYAALVNFAVHPDISTATYDIDTDTGPDSRLSVIRIPLRYEFKLQGRDWRPFLQANIAYQTLEGTFDLNSIIDGESIDSKWRTIGGAISAGVRIPVTDGLSILPAMTGGVSRIENDTDYHGEFSTILIKPAFDDIVFNWDADTWLLEAALGIDYRITLKKYDFLFHGSLTHNHVETYRSSSDFIEFSSQITTFDVNLESIHPTELTIRKMPLALVMTIGNTTFLGGERDALDFTYFFEAGIAFETDISRKKWLLNKLRLGGKGIFGDNVKGWSVIFGYRF